MGRKIHWFKMWSDGYLADRRIKQLSWGARGVFDTLICILRTQTDTPGFFVFDGVNAGEKELLSVLSEYESHTKRGRKNTHLYLIEVLSSGLFSTTSDGVMYSERIVKELEESELKTKAAYQRGKQDGDQGGDVEEEEEEEVEEKEEEGQRVVSTPTKTEGETARLAQTINEKWCAMTGDPPSTSHMRFYIVAKSYTEGTIWEAFDVVRRKLGEGEIKGDPVKFFKGCLRVAKKREYVPETAEEKTERLVENQTRALCRNLGLLKRDNTSNYWDQIRTVIQGNEKEKIKEAVDAAYKAEAADPEKYREQQAFVGAFLDSLQPEVT